MNSTRVAMPQRPSDNGKTGVMYTTMSESKTCPVVCPMLEACYARAHNRINDHWTKVDRGVRGGSWAELCERVAKLKAGSLWRHNVAGDLPHTDEVIDADAVSQLVAANAGRRGFTYTHHDMTIPANVDTVQAANAGGFTVNLSANNPAHADELADLAVAPVVTVLPEDAPATSYTPAGRRIIVCPAVQTEGVTCLSCKLCTKADRTVVIGFPVHGVRKKLAAQILGFTKEG